ncbi:MAG: hypothetical protein AB7U78_18220 [Hyphomicrobiaceae bacterium]
MSFRIGSRQKEETDTFDERFVFVFEPVVPKSLDEAVSQTSRAELILKFAVAGVVHRHDAHLNIQANSLQSDRSR